MRVVRTGRAGCADTSFDLRDDNDQSVAPVLASLEYLKARRHSPNAQSAYAHDLLHFFRFLQDVHLRWQESAATRHRTAEIPANAAEPSPHEAR